MFHTSPISDKLYLLSFALSFLLSLIFTKAIIAAFEGSTLLQNFINKETASPKKKVMTFGGVAVVLSFFITLWVFYFMGAIDNRNFKLLLILTLNTGFIFITGIYDDIFGSSPGGKVTVQLIIALMLYLSGFQIERIGNWLELNSFTFLFTALWIVGITNSINLIDGEDGLAGGIILFACLTLFFIYLRRDIFEASFLSIILAGSVLGFFIFNYPPAKIILGDTGSLPIGLLASLITLLPLNQGYIDEIYYLIPVVVLLVPIIDTALSFFRRILNGKNPFSKDKKHLHHRLVGLGLSPVQAISILFAICLYFDLISLIPAYFINLIPNFIPYFFIFIVGNIIFMLYILRYYEKR